MGYLVSETLVCCTWWRNTGRNAVVYIQSIILSLEAYHPEKHHRRSIRVKWYDYSQAGCYFITVCTKNRECLFGEIIDGEMHLNDAGRVVQTMWGQLSERFPHAESGTFVVMPNHIHGIVSIGVGAIRESPLHGKSSSNETARIIQRRNMLLPRIIGYFKMNSAKRINGLRGSHGVPVWQRSYYEHIVCDENDLRHIRQYIVGNPARWAEDEDNPNNPLHRRGDS